MIMVSIIFALGSKLTCSLHSEIGQRQDFSRLHHFFRESLKMWVEAVSTAEDLPWRSS